MKTHPAARLLICEDNYGHKRTLQKSSLYSANETYCVYAIISGFLSNKHPTISHLAIPELLQTDVDAFLC